MEIGTSKLFGLVGRNIGYSFSRGYFAEKFKALQLDDHSYVNFDMQSISELPDVLKEHPNLIGFNVTIPYKEQIFDFLDEIDPIAQDIGAVNTVKITKDNKLIGFNTDAFGFEKSFCQGLQSQHTKALILGTGGASKAIEFVLNKLGIEYRFVSRNPKEVNQLSYSEINKKLMDTYKVIINCTPLGTYPDIEKLPEIPYEFVNASHYLFDLIYNPAQTAFLQQGIKKNAIVKNGLEMLEGQADKAWDIWQS